MGRVMKELSLYDIINKLEKDKGRKLDLTKSSDMFCLNLWVVGAIGQRESQIYALEQELRKLNAI
jgi:hypothetical protein